MIASCISPELSDRGFHLYKVPVFTELSYKRFVEERGDNYVFDLFMEICRERGVRFNGLRVQNGYVYALLGFYFDGANHKSTGIERRRGADR